MGELQPAPTLILDRAIKQYTVVSMLSSFMFSRSNSSSVSKSSSLLACCSAGVGSAGPVAAVAAVDVTDVGGGGGFVTSLTGDGEECFSVINGGLGDGV